MPPKLNQPPPKKLTLKEQLKKQRVNAVLLFMSLVCFTGFTLRSVGWQHLIGWDGPLANLEQGEALRKPFGSDTYAEINAGTDLNSLDAVWVPTGKRAVIRFKDDASTVEVEERTLIIIKEPLLRRYDRTHAKAAVQKVSGKAATVDAEGKKSNVAGPPSDKMPEPDPSPTASESPEPTPTPADSPFPSPSPKMLNLKDAEWHRKIYPHDKMSIFVLNKKPGHVVHFTWPDVVTGKFTVENNEGREVVSHELHGARDDSANLSLDHDYHWKLTLDSGTVLGPYIFTLKRIGKNQLKDVMKLGSDSVEVAW